MITTNHKKIINIITSLKKHLNFVYQGKLSKIILFGSQARGEANPDSDVDILVVLKNDINAVKEIKKNSKIISEICLDHDALINCMYISESTFNKDNSPLIKNIKKEGIVL